MLLDRQLGWLVAGTVALLATATAAGAVLRRRVTTDRARRTVDDVIARVNAWWALVGLLVAAFAAGRAAVFLLFAGASFLAMRELLTLTPTRRVDHAPLFHAFFTALPLQYALVCAGWYGLFAVALPVWFFLFVSLRVALTGEPRDYLARVATLVYGTTIGAYCLSHAPALLLLRIDGYEGQEHKLLVFLLLVVQLSDVAQYLWGKTLGRTPLLRSISPNKTVEGFVGGVATATALGAALSPVTPFGAPAAAALAGLAALAGVGGGLVTSAIKRDAGVKDYGDLLPGHGGVMDRVDSLAFAAPVFFHVVRWFWSST